MNCYVLVGGRSERMGRSKVDLFLERVAAAAREVFDAVIAVHRAGGEEIAGVATIREAAHEEEAPVFGVARALEHARGRCFILAVDYPLITAAVLRDLSGRFASSGKRILVPIWNGEPQMLCAGYASALLPRIEGRLAEGRLDLRGLLDEAEIVDENELRRHHAGEPLASVNTPEELEALRGADGERLFPPR